MKTLRQAWITTASVGALGAACTLATIGCSDDKPKESSEPAADEKATNDKEASPEPKANVRLAHQDIEVGARCDKDDLKVPIPGQEDACGLNGYECRNGKWREMMTYCNPPPPEPEPDSSADPGSPDGSQ